MKKVLSLVLCAVFAVMLCAPVSAATVEEVAGLDTVTAAKTRGMITPYWESTSTVTYGVTINSQGYATSAVNYYTYSSTDKIYLTATLQKLDGYSYSDVISWDAEGTGRCTLSKSRYVSRGTYRLMVVADVYTKNGTYVETVELYSTPKVY